MRVKIFIVFASFGWTGIAWAASPPAALAPITLQECYRRAKQISESVGISAENTRLLQHQYRAQIGSILPHLDWYKQQFYQDAGGQAGAGNVLTVQPLSYFQATQPIFGGFRDWATIEIVKSQAAQARFGEKSTDLQLLSDIAAAFYAAYTAQDTLSVLKEIRKLNQDQVDQLQHYVNVGRSRASEVLSAQTQLASLDAQIADAQRTWTEARHLLFFLTGVPAETPLQDDDRLTTAVTTVNDALGRATKRPDLLSAAEALHQAVVGIRYARGAHLPTLGASARYYTERVGFATDVRWDATFLLDVPLYEGGSSQAGVEAARSQEIIAQLTLARLRRDVDRQVRTAYDDFRQAYAEAEAYDKAVQLAQRNYEVQKREYRLGIINNLELLQLLTNMQDVRRQWLGARATARLNDIQLRIAMGEGL